MASFSRLGVRMGWCGSLLLLALVWLPGRSIGQVWEAARPFQEAFDNGVELYRAEKYAVAQAAFAEALAHAEPGVDLQRADAAYFHAVCAARLGRADAIFLLERFLDGYPESLRANTARFEIAKLYYEQHGYQQAVAHFAQLQRKAFTADVWAEIQFKKGYAHLQLNEEEQAIPLFAELKGGTSYYANPAAYYYGHIAYSQGHDATALAEFERLKDDPTFAPIVPYYIAQIYYRLGRYREVVDYVTPMLPNMSSKRKLEMQRVMSASYLALDEPQKALPYMENFLAESPQLARDDHYLAGILYQETGRCDLAVEHLEKAVTVADSISQNANYHLGYCYLQLGDSVGARRALELAASVNFNPTITEDALFNFAKLTMEQRVNPFADAVDAFARYIEEYPSSPRIDQAYTYLGMAFSATRKYQRALEVLECVKMPTATTRNALQRASYYRGIELFQNLKYQEAIERFDYALKTPGMDPTLYAKALYWKAEAHYKLEQYAVAAKYYQDFLKAGGAFSRPEYPLASYNLGYCYFKMRNYPQAITWFRQFRGMLKDSDPQLLTDAYARVGDSYYIQRQYWPAIEFYDKAAKANGPGADYALYQQGFSLGLVDRPEKKIGVLGQMAARYPQSLYCGQADFEIAQTYQQMDQLQPAIEYYNRVINNYPGSQWVPQALVQVGLAQYALNNYDEAIQSFERVIKEYSGTPPMHEALAALERVYNAKGDVKPYLAYLEQIGQSERVSAPQRDSLIFSAAENQYMLGDCEKAQASLREYLAAYPEGAYSLTANYYLADCLLRHHDTAQAIAPLEAIVAKAPNARVEEALGRLAESYEYANRWSDAYSTLQKLEQVTTSPKVLRESRRARLRVAIALEDNERIVQSAKDLASTDALSPELMLFARYNLGKALLAQGKLDEAYAAYALIGKNTGSATGAEARYRMVEILAKQGQWTRVQEETLAFAKLNTPHQYWLAKAFILLAKSYEKQGDTYQAQATLKSVVDNYLDKKDGVVDEARRELERVLQRVASPTTPASSDTIQFKFQN
ncbi:MAG: tetratricopeptide repeat protein [Bacteroides sp.]